MGHLTSVQTHPRGGKRGRRCSFKEQFVFIPSVEARGKDRAGETARVPATVPRGGNPRLDQGGLDHFVQSLFLKGLAESTHKTYACGQRRYLGFAPQQVCRQCPQGKMYCASLWPRWPAKA